MPDPVSLGETVFETARLRLEPLRESHAAELFERLSDPLMYTFVPQDPPESLTWLAARYKRLETRLSADGSEEWLNWVVRSKVDGACIGAVQVTLGRDGRAQLAYEIGVPTWRRGFATEACARVIEALFQQGAVEVWAELDTRNEASIRLLERLGFQRGAFKPKADHFKGADSDEWTYSLPRPAESRRMHAAFRLAAFLGLLIAGAAVIGFGWRALGLPRQVKEGVVQPWSLLATGAHRLPLASLLVSRGVEPSRGARIRDARQRHALSGRALLHGPPRPRPPDRRLLRLRGLSGLVLRGGGDSRPAPRLRPPLGGRSGGVALLPG